ncbi:MAG: hypothetical protein KAT05_01205 [Spirochaetes bacterium]|nr:hypothetical protein [Spirochaetota bacterium]
MKTKIIIFLLALIFISGDFIGGCEEEEPNRGYITVIVNVSGAVYEKNEQGEPGVCIASLMAGLTVRIEIDKTGDERVIYNKVTDENCRYEAGTTFFKLYGEQHINVVAELKGGVIGYTRGHGMATLNWTDVYPSVDFGEVYNWNPTCEIWCWKD